MDTADKIRILRDGAVHYNSGGMTEFESWAENYCNGYGSSVLRLLNHVRQINSSPSSRLFSINESDIEALVKNDEIFSD